MAYRNLLLLALLGGAAGCDDLGVGGAPEELEIRVESTDASQIMLVTSSNWTFITDPACQPTQQECPEVLRVFDADTASVGSPHRRTLRFTNDFRYLVEVYPAGGQTATVLMRIEIDGKEWFNEARTLRPVGANGSQETLQFVYRWREPRLR